MLNKDYNSQSSAITSYNYTDIADATGMRLFYGAAQTSSVSTTYFLSQNQIYSSAIELVPLSQITFGADGIVGTWDLDLTAFNANQILRGTAIFNICFAVTALVSTGNHHFGHIVAKLRKWDGVTIMELGSVTSATTGGTPAKTITCLTIPITQTPFKKGDVLRLTLEAWGHTDAATNTGMVTIGTDPMNRDGTYIKPSTDTPTSTTQLKIWIPFNLDL
jgi:hypothetical protein